MTEQLISILKWIKKMFNAYNFPMFRFGLASKFKIHPKLVIILAKTCESMHSVS